MESQQRLAQPPVLRLAEPRKRQLACIADDRPLLGQEVGYSSVSVLDPRSPAASRLSNRCRPVREAIRRPTRSIRRRDGEAVRLRAHEKKVGKGEQVGGPLEQLLIDRGFRRRLPDRRERWLRLLIRDGRAVHVVCLPFSRSQRLFSGPVGLGGWSG